MQKTLIGVCVLFLMVSGCHQAEKEKQRGDADQLFQQTSDDYLMLIR